LSHDITARSKHTGERISYINIKAFNQSKSWILYESLSCPGFNAGVSGNGGSKSFSESDVKISISKFKYLTGEPTEEMESAVSSSKPCISASSIIKSVLRSIGSKNKEEDVKVCMDKESLDDVQRFLTEIQGSGEIVIDFL
jgi:hypothetical protein